MNLHAEINFEDDIRALARFPNRLPPTRTLCIHTRYFLCSRHCGLGLTLYSVQALVASHHVVPTRPIAAGGDCLLLNDY